MSKNDNTALLRLEELLKKIEAKGIKKLTSDEVLDFGHLYRHAASELATEKTQGVNQARIQYLNNLVSRAYGHIYVTETKGWPSVPNFFKKEFPQTFRKNLPFIAAAFIVSIVAALFAFGQVSKDPGLADVVMGPGASQMADSLAERHTGHKDWMPAEERPIMSSYIITNNIKVSIMAFALGIVAGIGTLGLMFYNGLMLGVAAAAVRSAGGKVALSFWSFVAPHGVIELTAIFIAGGAGLMLGWALLCPGEFTRGAAIKLAAREAFKLMLGVAAMLLVAGIIEGFFSPSMIPDKIKLFTASMIGIALYSYLFVAGKNTEQKPQIKAAPHA